MTIKNVNNIKKEIKEYQNRIVRIEEDVEPSTLNPNPYNFRKHQQPQKETMKSIFEEIGNIGVILVSDKTRNVIDGHMRVNIYLESNQLIPYVAFIDFENEEEERKAILFFDQIGNMARTDRDILKEVIDSTRVKGEKALTLVEKLAKKKKINIKVGDDGNIDAKLKKDDGDKEQIEKHFNKLIEKWEVSKHTIWKLDDIYLIKGDCTDVATKQMISEYNPDCILTDPPYGIDVVGSDGRIGLAKHFGDIKGDTEEFDPENILSFGLPAIIWGANHFSSKLPDFPRVLLWYKKGVGNESNDFADGEIAWCHKKGALKSFDHVWRGAARASERGVPRVHPTQKPIKLFEWCISEFLSDKKCILDMYAGSSTTGIAAYNMRKKAVLVEIDERYIAVSLERLERNLGKGKVEVVK